jgi:hypothetical protein
MRHAGSGRLDPVAQSQSLENRQAGRLEEKASADGAWRSEALEEARPEAGALQEDRRGHAGDAAADDCDFEGANCHG